MQPISTSRSPRSGSRPVVSVSRTISRMDLRNRRLGESGSPLRHLNDLGQNVADCRAHRVQSVRRIHHEIRACAFRHVAAAPEWRRAPHSSWCRAPESARAGSPDGRDHDDGIDAFLAAGLEQQRDIHHHDRRAGRSASSRNFLGGAEHRVNDRSSCLIAAGSCTTLADSFARSTPPSTACRKCRLDRGCRLAFIDFVDGGIGVVNRHARLSEQFCGGGFSHPDRAGQSEYPHQFAVSRRYQIPSSPSPRRNASSGSSGRPRIVK